MEGFRNYIADCIDINYNDDFADRFSGKYCYHGGYDLNGKLVIDTKELFDEFERHFFILRCDTSNCVVLNIPLDHFTMDQTGLVVEFNNITVDKNTFSSMKLKGVVFDNCIIKDLSMFDTEMFVFKSCTVQDFKQVNKCQFFDCCLTFEGAFNTKCKELVFSNCEMKNIEEIAAERVEISGGCIDKLRILSGKSISFSHLSIDTPRSPITFSGCDKFVFVSDVIGYCFNPFKVNSLDLYDLKDCIFSSVEANVACIENVENVNFMQLICQCINEKKASYSIGGKPNQSFMTRMYRKLIWW